MHLATHWHLHCAKLFATASIRRSTAAHGATLRRANDPPYLLSDLNLSTSEPSGVWSQCSMVVECDVVTVQVQDYTTTVHARMG
jgi:hypothetical protein